MAAKGPGVYFPGDENVLKIAVTVAQICEYTKNQCVAHF